MKQNISHVLLVILILVLIVGCSGKEKCCNVENECKAVTYSKFTFYDIDRPLDEDELCRMAKQIISDYGYSLKEDCTDSDISENSKAHFVNLQVSKRLKKYVFSMAIPKKVDSVNFFFSPGDKTKNKERSTEESKVMRIPLLNFTSSYPIQIKTVVNHTLMIENKGNENYTFTLDEGSVDSGIIEPGQTWEYTVKKPGQFDYHCKLHPEIKGTLIVEG